jgi:hypothetical protein
VHDTSVAIIALVFFSQNFKKSSSVSLKGPSDDDTFPRELALWSPSRLSAIGVLNDSVFGAVVCGLKSLIFHFVRRFE